MNNTIPPAGDGQLERMNKLLVRILSKLISDHHQDYNTSVNKSNGFTLYRPTSGREAILPMDVSLRIETSETSAQQNN